MNLDPNLLQEMAIDQVAIAHQELLEEVTSQGKATEETYENLLLNTEALIMQVRSNTHENPADWAKHELEQRGITTEKTPDGKILAHEKGTTRPATDFEIALHYLL